jgi:HlyD family secretion protein
MSSTFVKTAVFITAGAAVAALVAVLATRGNHAATSVSTTHAVRRDLRSWISSNGKVEPIEPQAVQAKFTTFIQRVSVREGQNVNAGQELATLDARDMETQLVHLREQLVASQHESNIATGGGDPDTIADLRNNLTKTNAEIVQLQREGDILERLYSKQASTRQEIDQNKSALLKADADKKLFEQKLNEIRQRADVQGQRARLQVEETQHAIALLEDKLKSAVVRASAAGTIYSLTARQGVFVHEGDLLAEIADLARIRVRIYVDEPDLGSLNEGQPVEITWDGFPNHVWSGRVQQLPKTIVAHGSRNVGEVLCSVNGMDSKLLPNTNVNVRIRTAERNNSLTLTRGAVRTEGNKHYVFLVDQGRVRKQEVEVGISNSSDYEVLSGITEKDVIALPGTFELHDGLAVNVS